VHHVEASRLSVERSSRAHDEVHQDWLLESNVSNDLHLVGVVVGIHAPSDHCLVSINKSVKPSSELPVAILEVWHVCQNDCRTI
jgi:hypothetical protein